VQLLCRILCHDCAGFCASRFWCRIQRCGHRLRGWGDRSSCRCLILNRVGGEHRGKFGEERRPIVRLEVVGKVAVDAADFSAIRGITAMVVLF
jgi:hypothetical protein